MMTLLGWVLFVAALGLVLMFVGCSSNKEKSNFVYFTGAFVVIAAVAFGIGVMATMNSRTNCTSETYQ